jgi:uncharacterized protein YgfB (UPF0149 family)
MPVGCAAPAPDAAMSMSQTPDSLFGSCRWVLLGIGLTADELQAENTQPTSSNLRFPSP